MVANNLISKKRKFLKVNSFLIGVAALATASPAIAGPFTCNGDIYQVQSGQLRILDPITITYSDVGSRQSPSYNAAGYNILDDFAYGIQAGQIVRIHSDGSLDVLFSAGGDGFAGDVDNVGNLWVRDTNTQYRRINLTTGVIDIINFTGTSGGGTDFVFALDGGVPYLLVFHEQAVTRLNLNTNVAELLPVSNTPVGGYGAQWTDVNGRVFGFHNVTGNIYEFFDPFSATPNARLVGVSDPDGNNDGFSCPLASFPNLPPLAQNDDFTIAFGSDATGNVLDDNGNGVDSDPDVTALTVSTTPVSAPSNGSVTLLSDGNFTYTPNTGFVGSDSFTYQITDASGLQSTAVVTITIPSVPIDLVTIKTLASTNITPSVGDTVTFTITVENNGPTPETNISLTDLLPSQMTPTANNGNVSQGSYNASSGVWTIGDLDIGASATLIIEGVVNNGEEGNVIQNITSSADGDQSDPTTAGDDLSESVTVRNALITNNDDFSATGVPSTGGNTASVFANDTINGSNFTDADVVPTITDNDGLTGLVLNADGSFTIPASSAPGTYNIQYQLCEASNPSNCSIATVSITVTPTIDLAITKTNSPGVNGEIDQPNDILTTGNATTYVLTVTNNGPDSTTGAIVRDIVSSGLNCPASNLVTITGNGIPSGSFTIADLTGAGIALSTLNNGQAATLSYDCFVI